MAREITMQEALSRGTSKPGRKSQFNIDPIWLDGKPRILTNPEDWKGNAISFTGAFRRAARAVGVTAHLSVVSPTEVIGYVTC